MKFTKDNVLEVFKHWQDTSNGATGSFYSAINNLDDTPEKVVVPKFVAEWIEYSRSEGAELSNMLACYKDFRDKVLKTETDGERAVQWYVANPYKFIQAYEDGYTIEPEKLYYIPLPHLKTTDGIQQVLSKRDTYFASRPNENLKQRFTKEELAQVPEIYKPYAKPIEEEAND